MLKNIGYWHVNIFHRGEDFKLFLKAILGAMVMLFITGKGKITPKYSKQILLYVCLM